MLAFQLHELCPKLPRRPVLICALVVTNECTRVPRPVSRVASRKPLFGSPGTMPNVTPNGLSGLVASKCQPSSLEYVPAGASCPLDEVRLKNMSAKNDTLSDN